MTDDSDRIITLDNQVNKDEGISLRQLKQFKKNILDPALEQLATARTELQTAKDDIITLKTFRTNAIAESKTLKDRITALETP